MSKNVWILGLLMTSAANATEILTQPGGLPGAASLNKKSDAAEAPKTVNDGKSSAVSGDSKKSAPQESKTPASSVKPEPQNLKKPQEKPNASIVTKLETKVEPGLEQAKGLQTNPGGAETGSNDGGLVEATAKNKTAADNLTGIFTTIGKELDDLDKAEQELARMQNALTEARKSGEDIQKGIKESSEKTVLNVIENVNKIDKGYETDSQAITTANKNLTDTIGKIKEQLQKDQEKTQKDSEEAGVKPEVMEDASKKVNRAIQYLEDAIKQSQDVQGQAAKIVERLKAVLAKGYVKQIDTSSLLQKLSDALNILNVKAATNEANTTLGNIKADAVKSMEDYKQKINASSPQSSVSSTVSPSTKENTVPLKVGTATPSTTPSTTPAKK